MSAQTRPFFIVSSGRSGTKLMERVLSAEPTVTMHHEYMVHHIQPVAVRYQLGLANRHEVRHVLIETHRAAMTYAKTPLWGDSSNKLAWIVDILDQVFPDARFIHLVRDGRKVASSYFHKLGDECYDDEATAALAAYIDRYPALPAPPPEKRYWWPQPRRGQLARAAFKSYGQFERIAWHWAEAHRTIARHLEQVSADRQMLVRLEDLVASRETARRLFAFLDLKPSEEALALLAKPHNVNRPENHPLTNEQRQRFTAIAGDVMDRFGYAEAEEYVVNY